MVTSRSSFKPNEWEVIRQTPFWLWNLLCGETSPEVARATSEFLITEIGDPRFHSPLARVAFRSALTENPPPFAFRPSTQVWQEAFTALKNRSKPSEVAQFQMSLASVGRNLIKKFGGWLTSPNTTHLSPNEIFAGRLDQMWRALEFENHEKGLDAERGGCPDKEWHRFCLAPMHVWQLLSLLDGQFSPLETTILQNPVYPLYPPSSYFLLSDTQQKLDLYYREVTKPGCDALGYLQNAGIAADEILTAEKAQIFKMTLILIGRDTASANAENRITDKGFEILNQITAALGLDKSEKLNIRAAAALTTETVAQNEVPRFYTPVQPAKNMKNDLQNNGGEISPENTNLEPDSVIIPINNEVFSDEIYATTENTTENPQPVPTTAEIDDATATEQADTTPEIDLAEIEREAAASVPVTLDTFADYKKTIHALNNDLRQLLEITDEIKMQNVGALIKDMIRRVEENSFSIAVVGEFKRGKSTFINALLGKDILPSDILPCSATLNRVTYGVKPNVLVKFKDGREEQIGIDKLPDYVTKLTEESEELASTVKEAVVTYPIPYCQNNVEIIDTPGLNDDANMTDVTLSVLPQVDAAILVIMANSPFSEFERAFLEDKLLTSDLGRVIFLVTAIDRLNNPERDADRVVKAIRDRIRKYVMKRAAEQFGAESEEYEIYLRKIGEPRVFPVSPYQALQAKEKNDEELMKKSRFKDFETALEKFLSEERGAVFLQVPINRLLSAAFDVTSAFTIREGALKMQSGDFDAAYNKTLQEIEILRRRKEDEMQGVDEAAHTVENDIKPLILELDEIIRQTAANVIDNYEITETDLGSESLIKQLTQRINKQIQSDIQNASKTQLEKIQLLVQQGITRETLRWSDFSDELGEMSRGIESRFGAVQIEANESTVAQGAGILATLMGLGGMYTGYQVAGAKGMLTGGVASLGVGIGTMVALGVVAGTFLALPVLIIGTLLALPAGSWLTKKFFGEEKVKAFRENLKKQTLEGLEAQFAQGGIEKKIIAEIDNAFDALKDKIHTEVEATLQDTEKTLADLRLKRERDEILSDSERRQLYKMRRETMIIQKRAEKLNDLLLKIASV
ncbi:MAG TPA: dynamin family protein [Pyrinomonadaceae bacterium]|nr:dynamin family protein [Pyrinomonadaceae bacterium]